MPFASARGALGWSAVLAGAASDGRVVLFDTGGPGDRATLPDRLARRGLVPGDVGLVVLSHLHYDHAANWDLFSRADLAVSTRELEHADAGGDWAVLRHVVEPLRRTGRLVELSGAVELDVDMLAVPAPGHTPGSVALAAGDTVLCGDAVKDRWQLAEALACPPAARDTTQRSVVALADRARRLWPGHDGPLERDRDRWVLCAEASLRLDRPDGHHVDVARSAP
jgi:glyoxylase-like metal-dependent hydrolase (beta-lactamase superfamily II)